MMVKVETTDDWIHVVIRDDDRERGCMGFLVSFLPPDEHTMAMKDKFVSAMRRRIGAALEPLLADVDAAFAQVAALAKVAAA